MSTARWQSGFASQYQRQTFSVFAGTDGFSAFCASLASAIAAYSVQVSQ
jgi:hypothetical protein